MESNNKEYRTIVKRTKDLLEKDEGYDVDFKRNLQGVHSEDLVAFANSQNGGTILVGVDETTDKKGRQQGKVVGCDISDKNKLSIINKAQSCRPPVDIEIFAENTEDKPIYRIDIPSGKNKPYCTNKGEYMVRHDGRNVALTPDKLLDIYLDLQSHIFIERFKNATHELTHELEDTKRQIVELNDEIESIKLKVTDEVRTIIESIEKQFNCLNQT